MRPKGKHTQVADEPALCHEAVVEVEARRIESIDIFRGLNVLLMIFVDNLGLVKGLPWWTYHIPAEANGMTYVDMVFPAFLFLMGMSIPLSVRSRIAKGKTRYQIWAHVLVRSLALIVMGLFVANAPQVDARSTGISSPVWAALGFVSIGLCLVRFRESKHKAVFLGLRVIGLALLVGLAASFKRVTADGHIGWLDFSDWEILGLLGWAYLSVSAIYLVFSKRLVVLVFALAGFVLINAMSTAERLWWLNSLPFYLKPFEAGLSSITTAGLFASLFITDDTIAPSLRQKVGWALGAALLLFIVGWFLRPLGISKIRDTPTWCLYCVSANLVIAILLYWIADVRRRARWAGLTKITGKNALLAYFLPYIAYLIPPLGWLTADGTAGWPGVAKSAFFTSFILAAVALLQQFKISLRI